LPESRSRLSGLPADRELTPYRRQQLLRWCKDNGLLGILLERLISARLAPARARTTGHVGFAQTTFRFASGSWRSEVFNSFRSRGLRHPEVVLDLYPMAATDAPERRPVTLDDPEVLAFFPAATATSPPTWTLPKPGGEEFWRVYGEPVAEIVTAVRRIDSALRDLATTQEDVADDPFVVLESAATGKPRQTQTDFARDVREQGRRSLNALTSRSSQVVVFRDGVPEVGQSYVSLWGALSLMAVPAVVKNRVRICGRERCRAPFVATAHGNLYCSQKCKSAAAQARLREARRAAGQGADAESGKGRQHG